MPLLKGKLALCIDPIAPVFDELFSIFRETIIVTKIPLNISCIDVPL